MGWHRAPLALLAAVALALPAAALGPGLSVPGAGAALAPAGADAPLPGARVRAELALVAERLGVDAAQPALGPCPAFEDAVRQHFAYLGLDAPAAVPAVEPSLAASVACLLDAMLAANRVRDALFLDAGGVPPLPWPLPDDPLLAPAWAVPDVPLGPLLGAAMAVADRVDQVVLALRAAPSPAAAQPRVGLALPELDLQPVLAIDRSGDTLYDCDYALVIDEVGDDLYLNNAGGSMISLSGLALFDTIGEPGRCGVWAQPLGENLPGVALGGEFEFGFLLTAAVVVDTHGHDTYGQRDAPRLDAPCTSEPIVRRIAIQGAGVIGLGMLYDTAGDNLLLGKTLAQGLGHSAGIGALYLGPGNDRLEAIRSSQGTGVFAGIGVLVNEAGDDVYHMRSPAGGTFNPDLGICDGTARYGQGSGFGRVNGVASGTTGVLRELDGNDLYVADLKSQGSAQVFSTGLLVDEAGDDTYVAGTQAMGYAEGHRDTGGYGAALLLERRGNDRYLLGQAPGLGAGGGELRDPAGAPGVYLPPTLWVNDVVAYQVNPLLLVGVGAMVDEEGDDAYSLGSRGNAKTASDTLLGVFWDQR